MTEKYLAHLYGIDNSHFWAVRLVSNPFHLLYYLCLNLALKPRPLPPSVIKMACQETCLLMFLAAAFIVLAGNGESLLLCNLICQEPMKQKDVMYIYSELKSLLWR